MVPPLRSAIDALAGAILGAAVCFALVALFQLHLLVAGSVGASVFVLVFATLGRSQVATTAGMARFAPAALEFTEGAGEPLLDRQPASEPPSSRAVRSSGPMATPGEMHEAIERHLSSAARRAPDASDALREALAQLRRGVR